VESVEGLNRTIMSMSQKRLYNIPGFSIDRVAEAAGSDPDVLRLENLDCDLTPPSEAIDATRSALEDDNANSYLPFTGTITLREAVAERLFTSTGKQYDPDTQIVVTCGGTEGMFDALLGVTEPGDEVIVTDPTYAGMIYRIRLAGCVPRFVPFLVSQGEWRLSLDDLWKTANEKTRALFLMNPSMPSGAVLNEEEWKSIQQLCVNRSILLLYNAAMERILFDERKVIHPASFDGMEEFTITIGSVSKEFRMIGWRIGWVAGPRDIMNDISRVHIYNVVTATGIAQSGAIAALLSDGADFRRCLAEWQNRRNMVREQLKDYSIVRPDGGWSLLVDVGRLGLDSFFASDLLLTKGKVAATPMRDWGSAICDRYVRLVFSNEPLTRLSSLRERFQNALPFPLSDK